MSGEHSGPQPAKNARAVSRYRVDNAGDQPLGGLGMPTNRKRKQRAAPVADYGPRQRLENGTAVLVYRADPERPQAPAIRAARAYVAYEALYSQGLLSDAEREAADRILIAAELITGAKLGDGGGLGGRAFWECGGVSPRMVQAAADLRAVQVVLDAATADAVARLVLNGSALFIARARIGLTAMARHWGMG